MNFTERKVTRRYWCSHSVSLVACIVPVAQCLCVYNPSRQSLREGVMSHLPLFSFCQAQYLVQSGNSINTCLMLLNISGSRSVICALPESSLISQAAVSEELTEVFFQLFGLYYTIKTTQIRRALRKPGAGAKVMCVCLRSLLS